MRKLSLIFALLFAALLIAACSSQASPSDSSDNKPVNIQVESDPNPAVVGDITFTLHITDETGAPLEGARVDVSVDHSDMTGMTMSGPASEQEAGNYAITADFSMSGNWKMTVYVRKDSLDYKEDFDLKMNNMNRQLALCGAHKTL